MIRLRLYLFKIKLINIVHLVMFTIVILKYIGYVTSVPASPIVPLVHPSNLPELIIWYRTKANKTKIILVFAMVVCKKIAPFVPFFACHWLTQIRNKLLVIFFLVEIMASAVTINYFNNRYNNIFCFSYVVCFNTNTILTY